jgi:hypothetical protein
MTAAAVVRDVRNLPGGKGEACFGAPGGVRSRARRCDRAALGVWRSTWDCRRHGHGAGGWNWDELVASYHRRAALLPLAIWNGSDLCGLALGCASRHRAAGLRHTMTLNYIERRPEPPRVTLRGLVVPLAVAAARNYGLAPGATRLRLAYPDPRLLGYDGALGFSVAWKGATPLCCEQEI